MILKQILFLTALFPCFRKKAGPICPQTGPCLKQNRPKTTFRQQPYAAKQARSRWKYYHNPDDSTILKITTESRPAHPKPPVRLQHRADSSSDAPPRQPHSRACPPSADRVNLYHPLYMISQFPPHIPHAGPVPGSSWPESTCPKSPPPPGAPGTACGIPA